MRKLFLGLLLLATTLLVGAFAVRQQYVNVPIRYAIVSAIQFPGQTVEFDLDVPIKGNYYIETAPGPGGAPIDTFLEIRHDGGALIAKDDDGGRLGSSRIMRVLPVGHYEIHVRHYDPTKVGSFRLIVWW